MFDFNYHQPRSIEEASALLSASEDARLLAGGMTLLPTLKNRLSSPSDLVDLSAIDQLRGSKVENGYVVLGAMTQHSAVATSSEIRSVLPVLSQLAGLIGDPCVRNRGTVGGSVANADPAADYPAAVVGLDAIVRTNRRDIEADKFFKGFFETELQPDEIITSIHFRIPDQAVYLKYRHPASGYAVIGTLAARYGRNVRVAVTGAAGCVFRHVAAENALEGSFRAEAVANLEVSPGELLNDVHFSAAYRSHLVKVYVRRGVEALSQSGRPHGKSETP